MRALMPVEALYPGLFTLCDMCFSVALALAPPQSPASLLRHLRDAMCRWPRLVPAGVIERLPEWFVGFSGPFGFGCGKGCEFLGAWLLLGLWEGEPWPQALHLGRLPSVRALLGVLALAAGVNVVLAVWSRHGRGYRGDHASLHRLVDNSVDRPLTMVEHGGLALLALGNAVFEEGVSRGFFMFELRQRGQLSPHMANLVQAAAFGLWHYHGIPSGIAGVGLTFIYGGLMGLLHSFGGGMLLPIIAHSIADYFIFVFIARQQAEKGA